MHTALRKIAATLMFAITGLLAMPANATLTLQVTASTATDFDFTVSGDFSGYTTPVSLTNFLYLVPMDSCNNPVTTWVPSEQTGDYPNGAINGNTISGWVFIDSAVRSDDYSFLAGDSFTVSFNGGSYDSTAVMTSDYTRSQAGLTLNPAGIDHFNLYWGRTVLVASTPSAGLACSSAAPIPTLSVHGLVLAMLGLLAVAGISLRALAKREKKSRGQV